MTAKGPAMQLMPRPWRAGVLLGVLALAALAAAPPAGPEDLLRDGDAAFARGDYARAAALYEQAEVRSTEPARVAFRLAGAKYRLAAGADSERLRLLHEAETLYRCAAGEGEPTRGEALYGLACCLLEKALQRNRAAAEEALQRLEECLAVGVPAELVERARRNLERARLLAWQARPAAAPESKDPQQGDQNPKPKPQPPDPMNDPGLGTTQPGTGTPQPVPGTGTVKPDPRLKPEGTSTQAPPGEGDLPPVPDRGPVSPLPRDEALQRLAEAHRRVLEEQQAYRQRTSRAAARNVPDW
jgi:tetratricopeptide (TPR) repeat protein